MTEPKTLLEPLQLLEAIRLATGHVRSRWPLADAEIMMIAKAVLDMNHMIAGIRGAYTALERTSDFMAGWQAGDPTESNYYLASVNGASPHVTELWFNSSSKTWWQRDTAFLPSMPHTRAVQGVYAWRPLPDAPPLPTK